MLPSGWVTPARAPGVKSFQSKSGLVSVGSARNLFRGWYQPAFQKRFFSTWSEVKKASMPPEFAVISTVIFCRAWISGSVSHLTFIPESDSNSGMFFSSTSMNGCLVRSRNSSLPEKRFQLKPCARAGVQTKGPAATPAATDFKKWRRVNRRAAMGVSSHPVGSSGPAVVPGTQPLEPDLAESWSQPNDRTYVFRLRKGVRWHPKPPVNGRELTADDVKYTYDRFLQVKGNPNRSTLGHVEKIDVLD